MTALMTAFTCTTEHAESPSPRNLLLRMMDAIAEQHMRTAHRAISRAQVWSVSPGEAKDDAPAKA